MSLLKFKKKTTDEILRFVYVSECLAVCFPLFFPFIFVCAYGIDPLQAASFVSTCKRSASFDFKLKSPPLSELKLSHPTRVFIIEIKVCFLENFIKIIREIDIHIFLTTTLIPED